jgi:hypothetical protein
LLTGSLNNPSSSCDKFVATNEISLGEKEDRIHREIEKKILTSLSAIIVRVKRPIELKTALSQSSHITDVFINLASKLALKNRL